MQTARARLAGLPATVVQINFRYAGQALESLGIDKVNGALLDLGVSSHQLDDAARGFSLPCGCTAGHADEPAGRNGSGPCEHRRAAKSWHAFCGITAKNLSHGRSRAGSWRQGRIPPIETTLQLADIVASAMPPAERRKNKNPSRRTFQALRIAVNHELDALEEGLILFLITLRRAAGCA